MSPAIECRCGERFETPRPSEATAEEMLRMIEDAVVHIQINLSDLLFATPSHSVTNNLSYEPVTGGPKTHIDFHTKEAITEGPKKT